ncbi:MAG TPA: hypothetical protein VH186_10280 [Chloroflexia bacterium]|nr:hypothetical protein [Chloroflexia bacterium]
MPEARFYQSNGIPVTELASAAAGFFRQDNFDTNYYQDYAGRTVLQIGKQQGARFLLGLAYSLTVVFTPQQEDRILVELGGESWGDKVASGAVGAFFLPPLLFTAAFGAWKQSELDDRFWNFLNGYILNRSGRPGNPVTAVPYYNGPQQQQPNTFQSFFAPPPPPPPAGMGPQGYQGYQNSAYGYAPQDAAQPPYPAPWPEVNPSQPVTGRGSWFDPQNLQPVFDQQVGKMGSWQAVMADGVINYQELSEQQSQVDRLQQRAEEMLDTNARLKLAEVLNELNRLEQLQRDALARSYSSLQNLVKKEL